MKWFLISFFLFNLTAFGQQVKNVQFNDTVKMFKRSDFLKSFGNDPVGVVFFYPRDDQKKWDGFKSQVIDIAQNERFKKSKVFGVSFETTVNDKDNVYFEQYNVTDIQCVIYCKNKVNLDKVIKNLEVFQIQPVNLPPDFYLIDIKKEVVCVRENRIIFFADLIYDLTDPVLSDKELILQSQRKIEQLQVSMDSLKTKVISLEKQVADLKLELNKKDEPVVDDTKTIEKGKNSIKKNSDSDPKKQEKPGTGINDIEKKKVKELETGESN